VATVAFNSTGSATLFSEWPRWPTTDAFELIGGAINRRHTVATPATINVSLNTGTGNLTVTTLSMGGYSFTPAVIPMTKTFDEASADTIDWASSGAGYVFTYKRDFSAMWFAITRDNWPAVTGSFYSAIPELTDWRVSGFSIG
jgi:hypothetical protein